MQDREGYRTIALYRTQVEKQYSLKQMSAHHHELMRSLTGQDATVASQLEVEAEELQTGGKPDMTDKFLPLFTVFTPTFNRAETLRRPYESLQKQTLRDFEWLVIDDGSTDNTREVVQGWQREADFRIRYAWQENASKAAAWNRALELARGEFFICLDSDDGCVPEALLSFKEHWESIPAQERVLFSGITTLAVDQKGNNHGPDFPKSPLDCTATRTTYALKFTHDSWQCYRTEIIRQYPFELLPGYHNYLPESTVINRVAKVYLQRHINQRLLIVDTSDHTNVYEHQAVGLGAKASLKNAPGYRASHLSLLRHQLKLISSSPVHFYKVAANYIRFSWMQGISASAQIAELGSMPARALWLAALPAAAVLRLRDRAMQRKSLAEV